MCLASYQDRMRAMSNRFQFRVSRRDALQVGLAVGVGTALTMRRPVWAATTAPAQLALITKAIPATGEKLPAVGLGTDQFRSSERDAIQAEIQRLQQLGGTAIDTAAAYGDSESLIGDALAALNIRDRMFVATKLTANEAGSSGRGGKGRFHTPLAAVRAQ